MNRKAIHHIIIILSKELKKELRRIIKNSSQDNIHDFRIAVKKFRAFIRMLNRHTSGTNNINLSGKIKRIYKQTGKIRDLQLQIARINDRKSNETDLSAYLFRLNKALNKRTRKLAKTFNTISTKKIRLIKAPDRFKRLPAEAIHSFIDKKSIVLRKLLSKCTVSDQTMHRIRKNMKDLLYLFTIREQFNLNTIAESYWNDSKIQQADQLAGELGQYNDLCLATSFINAAYLNKLNPATVRQLRMIRQQWEIDKNNFKEKLHKELIKFLPAA